MLPVEPKIAIRFMDVDMVLEAVFGCWLLAIGCCTCRPGRPRLGGQVRAPAPTCLDYTRSRGIRAPVDRLYSSYSGPKVLRMNPSSILLLIQNPSHSRTIAKKPRGSRRANAVPIMASKRPEQIGWRTQA